MIRIFVHRIIETIANRESLGRKLAPLVFEGFEISAGIVGTDAITADENVVRQRHQIFEEEEWGDAVIINTVREREIELTILPDIGIVKIIHDHLDVLPIETVVSNHGFDKTLRAGFDAGYAGRAQVNQRGGLCALHRTKLDYPLTG